MEWEPKQQDLGALGFAGICREIYRVLLRAAILPHSKGGRGAAILTALLLVHAAAIHAVDPRSRPNHRVACVLFHAIFTRVLLQLSFICTAAYVCRVASLYFPDAAYSDAGVRMLRDLPRAPLELLLFKDLYILLASLFWFVLLQLDSWGKIVVLPLELVAYAVLFAVLSHIACVMAVLQEAVLFSALPLRKTVKLLAGMFWTAAAVFVPLDGCFVALLICFISLVLNDALALGLFFQVAAGAAMAVALWAVLVVMMVAQPVVYLACKSRHHEVVDKVHLN